MITKLSAFSLSFADANQAEAIVLTDRFNKIFGSDSGYFGVLNTQTLSVFDIYESHKKALKLWAEVIGDELPLINTTHFTELLDWTAQSLLAVGCGYLKQVRYVAPFVITEQHLASNENNVVRLIK